MQAARVCGSAGDFVAPIRPGYSRWIGRQVAAEWGASGVKGFLPFLASISVAAACPAAANPPTAKIDVRGGDLASALQDVARQARIELLFDRKLVKGLRTGPLRGRMNPRDAVQRLLAGTNIVVRQTASGILVLEARETKALAEQDVAVPEILVIGRRSQNADIRRVESDIQPYRVATRREVVSSHRDNLDQFFRSRVPANTQVRSPGQLSEGETISEIDLRGLGPDGTLILIDGRRMPSIPRVLFGMRQPDLNALPLHAIDRVETLTGTAGGIHGFGALGGAVNVVIDRDTRGLQLHQTVGLSTRGDAPRVVTEGGFGYSPNDGSTEISFYAAHSWSDGIQSGDRDYRLRDRRLSAANIPASYIQALPYGNSIAIFSANGPLGDFNGSTPLTLKPSYGGGTLPSRYTYLPRDFIGGSGELAAALGQNAGKLDFSIGDGTARSDIGSASRTWAILANIRQHVVPGVEIYGDAIVLRNQGQSILRGSDGLLAIPETSPLNPFEQPIFVTFPVGGNERRAKVSYTSSRYTFGLVADLPYEWRGTAEAAFGSVRYRREASSESTYVSPYILYENPQSTINPFGDWAAFQSALLQDPYTGTASGSFRSRFREQSLRLAGPLFSTAAGRSTLTLLAERREDDLPAHVETQGFGYGGMFSEYDVKLAPRTSTSESLYAELRSRLFGDEAPIRFLSDLEVQLAARVDRQKYGFPSAPASFAPADQRRASFSSVTYTAGAKFSPVPGVLVRASYATGEQPPELTYLNEFVSTGTFGSAPDPKRAGTFLGSDGPYLYLASGFAGLKTIRANTLSLGTILSPWGENDLRLTFDYSRIRRSRDVLFLSSALVLAHEDFWPERVERGPLSDADRARGFTGGPVQTLDTRAMNGAGLEVEAIDARAEWPTSALGGQLRLYVDATYHMKSRQTGLFQTPVDRAGTRNGPLRWRANGGFHWSSGDLNLGANLQYFGPYQVSVPGQSGPGDALVQGGSHVRAQAYLDLYASQRVRMAGAGPLRDLTIAFGLINVFDHSPPRESNLNFRSEGISPYGDPRKRRFEITLSGGF